MKALRCAFTISRPFTKPTAAPTKRSTTKPRYGLRLRPAPKADAGAINQVASIGANP